MKFSIHSYQSPRKATNMRANMAGGANTCLGRVPDSTGSCFTIIIRQIFRIYPQTKSCAAFFGEYLKTKLYVSYCVVYGLLRITRVILGAGFCEFFIGMNANGVKLKGHARPTVCSTIIPRWCQCRSLVTRNSSKTKVFSKIFSLGRLNQSTSLKRWGEPLFHPWFKFRTTSVSALPHYPLFS